MNAAFARNLTDEELAHLVIYRTSSAGLDVLIREALLRASDDRDDREECEECEDAPTPNAVLDAVAP